MAALYHSLLVTHPLRKERRPLLVLVLPVVPHVSMEVAAETRAGWREVASDYGYCRKHL